jgi:hypothetical protein
MARSRRCRCHDASSGALPGSRRTRAARRPRVRPGVPRAVCIRGQWRGPRRRARADLLPRGRTGVDALHGLPRDHDRAAALCHDEAALDGDAHHVRETNHLCPALAVRAPARRPPARRSVAEQAACAVECSLRTTSPRSALDERPSRATMTRQSEPAPPNEVRHAVGQRSDSGRARSSATAAAGSSRPSRRSRECFPAAGREARRLDLTVGELSLPPNVPDELGASRDGVTVTAEGEPLVHGSGTTSSRQRRLRT